jgi:membrane protein involved in colicin uptake
MRGKAEGSALLEARWLGACKPDQRPGDYILSNGVKLRVSDPEEEKAAAKAAAEKAAAAEQAAKDAKAAKLAKPKRKGDSMPVPKLQ